MNKFMEGVDRIVEENKKRRRKEFLKAKRDEKRIVFSLFRPKRTNVYQKLLTQRKNKLCSVVDAVI